MTTLILMSSVVNIKFFGHCALSGVVGKLNEWEAYTFKMQNNDINIDSNISKDYYNTITVHDNSS